jgi:hypothetical protein
MQYNSTTTLNRIRAASPCEEGWTKLLKHLGKTKADDEPLDLLTVLDSNDLNDTLWVLSYAMPDDRLARHFQAWCADQVLHLFEADYPEDSRVRDQIAMLRNDTATDDQRYAAWSAAWAATRAAAREAAMDAAREAAWSAAWAATRAAAANVAWDAQEAQLRKMLGGKGQTYG